MAPIAPRKANLLRADFFGLVFFAFKASFERCDRLFFDFAISQPSTHLLIVSKIRSGEASSVKVQSFSLSLESITRVSGRQLDENKEEALGTNMVTCAKTMDSQFVSFMLPKYPLSPIAGVKWAWAMRHTPCSCIMRKINFRMPVHWEGLMNKAILTVLGLGACVLAVSVTDAAAQSSTVTVKVQIEDTKGSSPKVVTKSQKGKKGSPAAVVSSAKTSSKPSKRQTSKSSTPAAQKLWSNQKSAGLKRVQTTAVGSGLGRSSAQPTAAATSRPAGNPSQLIGPTQSIRSSGSGQSVVAMPAPANEAPKKRFSISLTDRALVNTALVNGQRDGRKTDQEQDIEASGEMSLRLGYAVTDKVKVGLGTDAEHSYGALNTGKANWILYDAFASISHSSLLTMPGDINLSGGFRFYAPTSEGSQAAGLIARLRGNVKLSRQFGPVSVYYSADPQYYVQSYLTSVTVKEAGAEEHSGNRQYRLLHFIGADWQINPKWSFSSMLGFDQGWYYNDPNFPNQKRRDETADLYAETSIGYQLIENLSLGAGVTQTAPNVLDQNSPEGPLYRDEFTKYFMEATLAF